MASGVEVFFLVVCITIPTCVYSRAQVVVADEPPQIPNNGDKLNSTQKADVKYLHYDTEIKNRFARTVVSTKVLNPSNEAREVGFDLILPDSAFISEFVMIIKDKEYKAYVKEKEEAKRIYDQAVEQGHSAARVELTARDSNKFQVSVNVEAGGKATFRLTYEDLLTRTLGLYNHIIHVNPGQIVKDLQVKVNIEEAVDIKTIRVPNFRTGNEIDPEDKKDDSIATIERDPIKRNVASVTWNPSKAEQKEIAEDGLKGKLVVQYDVDRSNSSQILLDEGYFVHFFAPDSEETLPKHIVFVLDVSGSMAGRRIEQLKESMLKIVSDLNRKDYFSIVVFSSDVYSWSPHKTKFLFNTRFNMYSSIPVQDPEIAAILNDTRDEILPATEKNVEDAKTFIQKLVETDATNIMGALRKGIELVSRGQKQFVAENNSVVVPHPIMVFLTDGYPNVEESDPNQIVNNTKNMNEIKTPIFSLSFGDGADLKFLRRLSLDNYGFARNIYEAGDAAIQLNNFYKEISSPVMADVSFNYLPGQVDNTTLTKQQFPIVFRGSEVIICGKLSDDKLDDFKAEIQVGKGGSSAGPTVLINDVIFPNRTIPPLQENRTISRMEKLWAYVRIKQLLDNNTATETTDGNSTEAKKEALRLALQYSFVTPLTSLVVVKPNESSTVDAETANPNPEHMPMFAGPAQYGLSYNKFASFARPIAMGGAPALGHSGFPGNSGFPGPSGYQHINGPVMLTFASTPAIFPDTTTITTKTDSSSQETDNLVALNQLVWLNLEDGVDPSIELMNKNVTVKLNETDVSYGMCTTPSGSEGNCRHLQYCSLSSFITSLQDYLPFYCDIQNKYAGVCCPFPVPS